VGGDYVEKEDCIFCKIIKKQIPCEMVYEDDKVIGFKDISPQAPVHAVIIPKEHFNDLNCLNEEQSELIGHIFMVAKEIAQTLGIAESGYRIVTNCGEQGGQTVQHIHFHLLGGRMLQWPPG
jgi:histidine triad (HIT) family protein